MPDTKLSWPHLREHIRKYIWIYVIGVAACLVLTSLLWTTTRPRIPDDQSVIVYLMDQWSNPAPLDGVARDMLARGQAYDETLQQVEFQSLQYIPDDYTSSILLMTRMSVSEGDAYLASAGGMEALVNAEAFMPLDGYVAEGWLSDFNLEPYYATYENEENPDERVTTLAGLRLDGVNALFDLGAFNNEGAILCLSAGGTNPETTLKTLEIMLEDLTEGKADAATDGTEPAA